MKKNNNSKRIVIFGYHEIANILLDFFIPNKNINIKLIITDPIKNNNQNSTWYRDIVKRASSSNIKIILKEKIDKNTINIVKKIKPAYIFSAFSSFIFPKQLIDLASIGCINFHNSDLPHDRGRAAPIFLKIKGKKIGCMTMHWIDQKIDNGNIIDKYFFKIRKSDSIIEIYLKNNFALTKILKKNISKIINGTLPVGLRSNCIGSYNKWDENNTPLIKFSKMTTDLIINKTKSLCYPFKGAHFYYNKKKIKIHKASKLLLKDNERPGLVKNVDDTYIIIKTLDYYIKIEILEYEGRLILASHLAEILKIKTKNFLE